MPPRRLTAVREVDNGKYRCPVTGCPKGKEGKECAIPFTLRWHFGYRHPTDKVVIGGECDLCCGNCGCEDYGREVSYTPLSKPK